MRSESIAHDEQNTGSSWAPPHLLAYHLLDTANKAGISASEFDNEDWVTLATEVAQTCHSK